MKYHVSLALTSALQPPLTPLEIQPSWSRVVHRCDHTALVILLLPSAPLPQPVTFAIVHDISLKHTSPKRRTQK